jgi:hypothetical protein
MRKFFPLFIAVTLILVTFSCKSEGEQAADELCDCMLDGVNTNTEIGSKTGMLGGALWAADCGACFLNYVQENRDVINDMSAEEKIEFVEDLITGFLDTDCGQDILELVPYNVLTYILIYGPEAFDDYKGMHKEQKREYYKEPYYNGGDKEIKGEYNGSNY